MSDTDTEHEPSPAWLERARLRLAAIDADSEDERELAQLEDEARRAREAMTKFDNEAGVYREAFARGGSLGPPEFYEALGKAYASVKGAELKLAKAKEGRR